MTLKYSVGCIWTTSSSQLTIFSLDVSFLSRDSAIGLRATAIESDVTGSARPRARQIQKCYVSRDGKPSREARKKMLRFKKWDVAFRRRPAGIFLR